MTSDKMREFMEFLSEPAEDNEDDEMLAWLRFAVCPNCAAEYPAFHSPLGTLGTLCDNCGWSSDEAAGL